MMMTVSVEPTSVTLSRWAQFFFGGPLERIGIGVAYLGDDACATWRERIAETERAHTAMRSSALSLLVDLPLKETAE
jgi:hypothetical protein